MAPFTRQAINNENIEVKPTSSYALFNSLPDLLCSIVIGIVAMRFHYKIMNWATTLLLAYSVYKYFYIRSHSYFITPEQIIHQWGILSKTAQSIELYRVRDYIVTQSLPQRMMGAMQLTLLTYDKGEPVLVMAGIPHSTIAQVIRNRVQQCRKNNRILTIDN